MSTKEELLKRLSEGVLEMEEDDVAEAAQEIFMQSLQRIICLQHYWIIIFSRVMRWALIHARWYGNVV